MSRQETGVEVSGGQVAVVDYGGTGPDVVLVHAVAQSSTAWEDVATTLSDDAHVVAVDLPGHGQSSAQATGFTQVVEDLLTVVDALGLHRPTLVGHDVSGGFVAAAAATAPDRVGGLVLIDSPTLQPQSVVRDTARMVSADEIMDMLVQRFGLGSRGPDAASKEAFIDRYAAHNKQDLLAAAPDEETMRALLRRAILTAPDGSWVFRPLPETMRALTRDEERPTVHPGRELLAELHVPVRAVVLTDGRHSADDQSLAADAPSVRVVTLQAGPYALYTHPKDLAREILAIAR